MPLLGVFQKLIASRANDHEGFYLLSSMIQYIPWQSLEAQMSQVFILLFQRLKGSKTTKFVKGKEFSSFKPQPHKMVKHTQTIRRLFPTNCLSLFDHYVGFALKGLITRYS